MSLFCVSFFGSGHTHTYAGRCTSETVVSWLCEMQRCAGGGYLPLFLAFAYAGVVHRLGISSAFGTDSSLGPKL